MRIKVLDELARRKVFTIEEGRNERQVEVDSQP